MFNKKKKLEERRKLIEEMKIKQAKEDIAEKLRIEVKRLREQNVTK